MRLAAPLLLFLLTISQAFAAWEFPPLARKFIEAGNHEAAVELVLATGTRAELGSPEAAVAVLKEVQRYPEFGLHVIARIVNDARAEAVKENKFDRFSTLLGLEVEVLSEQGAAVLSPERFRNPWAKEHPVSITFRDKNWIDLFSMLHPNFFSDYLKTLKINEITIGYSLTKNDRHNGVLIQPRFAKDGTDAIDHYRVAIFGLGREQDMPLKAAMSQSFMNVARLIKDGQHLPEDALILPPEPGARTRIVPNPVPFYFIAAFNPSHPQAEPLFLRMLKSGYDLNVALDAITLVPASSDALISALLEFAQTNKEPALREKALLRLGHVEQADSALQEALLEFWMHNDRQTAHAAMRALDFIAKKQKTLSERVLTKLLSYTHEINSQRYFNAWWIIGELETVPAGFARKLADVVHNGQTPQNFELAKLLKRAIESALKTAHANSESSHEYVSSLESALEKLCPIALKP